VTTLAQKSHARLQHARDLHESAVAAYVDHVNRIDEAAWRTLLRGGKWTPADVTQHLILTFDVLTRELRGGPGMRLRLNAVRRFMIRLTYVRRMLRGGAFPRGGSAPRELRPVVDPHTDRSAALDRMQQAATTFVEVTLREHAAGRGRRLTHPYFGAMSLPDALLISARHVEHHTRQLRGEF
jgi:hypothetical protein